MSETYFNQNGLENGEIPANKECPFLKTCSKRAVFCPSKEVKYDIGFVCSFAKLHSLVRNAERRGDGMDFMKAIVEGKNEE